MEDCIIAIVVAAVALICIAVATIANHHTDSNNDDYWEW